MPEGMRRLTNLTFLSLTNNWLHGPIPAWLQELPRLRVLNLGSQFGGNQGSPLTGLLGGIPPRLGALKFLRELQLDTNGLQGQLPPGLCNDQGEAQGARHRE